MKLTLDITPLLEDHWTGIPIFTRRLIQALLEEGSVELTFSHQMTEVPRAAVLDAMHAGCGTVLRGEFERKAGETYPLIDSAVPVFYPSVKECPGLLRREASVIHDVSTLVMPEFHDDENVKYHMANLAKQLDTDERVFCVSEATRQALILAYPSAAAKTRLLPQYVDWPPSFEAIERNLPPPMARRYAVVIGTIEPRKNLELLMRALEHPQVQDSDIQWVIVGKQGWKVERFIAELSASQRERFSFPGFITEFMKYRLLRNAEFLVYPSLYEGFGIPALEALSLGKPVLAAMTSSFPEVVGEAGIFFDPLSVTSFAEALAEMSEPAKREELAALAPAAAARYTSRQFIAPVLEWLAGWS
jgi:glycosyltransferase involved in cell wall biosynthesis